jgi:undecaprenyl-diphosphatase
MLETLKNIDTEVFLALNGVHNAVFDFIMFWASERFIWIPLYVFLAYLLFRKYGRKSWLFILMAGIVVTLTDQTSVHLFKFVFLRPRPCHEPELAGLVHLVNSKCGGPYGFISSHAANSFGIATYLALLLGRKIRFFAPAILLWAALLSYSRVYLGVHYPGDILVGAIWGSAMGAAVFVIAARIYKSYIRS